MMGGRPLRLTFSSRDEAKQWVLTNQLGRRNLTDAQRTVLIGRLYNSRKGDRRDNLRKGDEAPKAPGEPSENGDVAEAIAEQFGVARNTVKRAGTYAEGLDRIAEVNPKAAAEILAGESPLKKRDVIAAAKAETKKAVKETVREAEATSTRRDFLDREVQVDRGCF